MAHAILRPTATNSIVVVVDIQEKLVAKMPAAAALTASVAFLLDAAALFNVPIRATEQYPQGLGPTVPELVNRIPGERPAKTAFSCCGAAGFLAELRQTQRNVVVLVGMETHVCISQTALDLREAGFDVVIPADAVGARFAIDHEMAIKRLAKAGVLVTTAESVAFEWAGDAAHPHFKAFSKLVIQRSGSR